MSGFDSAAVKEYLLELQELIVERLEQVDGKKFLRDAWDRPEGAGLSCILEEGNVLERGGIAFSHMKGARMPVAATSVLSALFRVRIALPMASSLPAPE